MFKIENHCLVDGETARSRAKQTIENSETKEENGEEENSEAKFDQIQETSRTLCSKFRYDLIRLQKLDFVSASDEIFLKYLFCSFSSKNL
jgi:hypothetical protein